MKHIILFLVGGIVLSCSSTQKVEKQTYWVHSAKVQCDAGAGKMECLQISKNDNLQDAQWEYFYAPIENFTFEKGFFKKIQVRIEQLTHVPADASSKKYTMIKEIEKKQDIIYQLHQNWVLDKIKGETITHNRPNIQIEENKTINGNGGCNHYFGSITELTQNRLQLGPIGATRKMCLDDNVEMRYFEALSQVRYFRIEKEQLILLDDSEQELLVFGAKK